MKRRNFLKLFGAGVTAPLMPALPVRAASASAAITPAAVHAAIYHAQSRAVFSVWGLARAANLTIAQATAVMDHLAGRGILGPLQGTTHGGRWARSNILNSRTLAKARAARRAFEARLAGPESPGMRHLDVDLSRLLAHLRALGDRYQSGKAAPV